MHERDLYSIFAKKIKVAEPRAWVYKIPDAPGGGKRPFDMILILPLETFMALPIAIEMKLKNKEPTKYQAFQLNEVNKANGIGLVYTYSDETMDEFVQRIMEIRNALRKN